MSEKIQKNVITLLAVILVVISMVSTFVVVGKITFEEPRMPQAGKTGEIRLQILGPPQLPQSVESSGKVSLTVLPYEES